jgi:hypothetical protein
MATIKQLPSGYWRVQVRRKGLYASKTFRIKSDAQRWANGQEDRLDRGESVSKQDRPTDTLGDLIELHQVGRAARRSKEYTLNRLKLSLGSIHTSALTRHSIVEFGRKRAKEGAGPVTIAVDISYLGTVLQHASAVYGYQVPTEQLRLGRAALLHLGLIAKSNERNRRSKNAPEQTLAIRRSFMRFNHATMSLEAATERTISPPETITVSKGFRVSGSVVSLIPDELSISPPPGASSVST